MNQKLFILTMMFLALTSSLFNTFTVGTVKGQTQEVEYWAVILCAAEIEGGTMGGPGDVAYAYHVLSTHYAFNDIYYLHYNTSIPEVDAYANSTNFRWAITNWLSDKAYSNNATDDIMFVYVIAHGGGIAEPGPVIPVWGDNLTLLGGCYDENYDEKYNSLFEIQEAHVIDRWNSSQPVDVNNDTYIRGWVGIDEVLCFYDKWDNMTDDEISSDLATLDGKYKTLIFATQQCMGGGLIDDLSGPNRIIITAIDETHLAIADVGDDSLSEWSAAFFDALHGEDTSYNAITGELVHEGTPVDADYDGDGNVSILEIFNYTSAYMEDVGNNPAVNYTQTVWLDDDGNRLPTYVNETDYGSHCDNGSLASNTWFPKNIPPYTPSKPDGPQSGYTNTMYTYYTNSTDPNGDNLTYVFDWDDGTTKTVGPFDSGENASASHSWSSPGTYNVTVKAQDTHGAWSTWSQGLIVNITERIRYMQNAKWDSTYWKLLCNNTSTSAYRSSTKTGYYLKGYLGVKIYKGTQCISNGVKQVGCWYHLQSGLRSTTWNCEEQNVTGTYIKVEIWYKFQGDSYWTNMNIPFKTETFTQNTILNATTWTIFLWGEYHILYGPTRLEWDENKSTIAFSWGSSSEESRIEDMIFTNK